jgi:hypothetical protein
VFAGLVVSTVAAAGVTGVQAAEPGQPIAAGNNGTAVYGSLSAVSCAAATACTAVGDYLNSAGGDVTLAESWNGKAWVSEAPADPSGATRSVLSGVACTVATACTAVGFYYDSVGNQFTLAERWNGTSWAIQPTSNPSGGSSSVLSAVACVGVTACTAVGNYFSNSANAFVTLAERWNGTSWAIQATPNPSGANPSELTAVACTSTTACTAVGDFSNSAGTDVTLAERWNGTSWAIQATPNRAGAASSAFLGVSCTVATACTAVGSDNVLTTGAQVTLVERWNGTSWVIQASPNPPGQNQTHLSAVACTSSNACASVGDYVNGSGVRVTLAESWDGTSWVIRPAPNPSGADYSVLLGLACTAATACTAVGDFSNSAGATPTLAERWNGTSWVIQATPTPSGGGYSALSAVACTGPNACTAIGFYTNSIGTEATLAERWNGTSWAIQATPNPSGARSSLLSGVACTSTTACTAIGYYNNTAGAFLTLVERWNGTSWSIQPTPNPSGSNESVLSGVACTAATACTAVGYDFNTGGTAVTLVERWNGTSWAIQSTPNPSGAAGSNLSDVACTSSTSCTAVGLQYNQVLTYTNLAEHWNGTSWAIQATPNHSGAIRSILSGVACTAATACTAVGSYTPPSGNPATLVELWNGTSWAIRSTPNPVGGTSNVLTGVACSAATACTAVGSYDNTAGTGVTLAERWNGTSWAVQSTSNPPGGSANALSAVACTGPTACAAVGQYLSGATQGTLAERWNGTSWSVQSTPNGSVPR